MHIVALYDNYTPTWSLYIFAQYRKYHVSTCTLWKDWILHIKVSVGISCCFLIMRVVFELLTTIVGVLLCCCWRQQYPKLDDVTVVNVMSSAEMGGGWLDSTKFIWRKTIRLTPLEWWPLVLWPSCCQLAQSWRCMCCHVGIEMEIWDGYYKSSWDLCPIISSSVSLVSNA